MEKINEFFKSHIDFRVYPVLIWVIITAAAIYPCERFLPAEYGFENGLLENIQMLILALCFIFSIFAKSCKKFFYFVALVIFLLAAREINYGRTIFFPVPGEVNTYYSWKEIKYGWLANPLIGLYLAGTCVYFLINKIYQQMFTIIKNIKFPIWNFIFLFLGIVLGTFAEKSGQNFLLEEACELLFYVSLMSIIWLYAFNKNFQIDEI